jgi:hypothetical protein
MLTTKRRSHETIGVKTHVSYVAFERALVLPNQGLRLGVFWTHLKKGQGGANQWDSEGSGLAGRIIILE